MKPESFIRGVNRSKGLRTSVLHPEDNKTPLYLTLHYAGALSNMPVGSSEYRSKLKELAWVGGDHRYMWLSFALNSATLSDFAVLVRYNVQDNGKPDDTVEYITWGGTYGNFSLAKVWPFGVSQPQVEPSGFVNVVIAELLRQYVKVIRRELKVPVSKPTPTPAAPGQSRNYNFEVPLRGLDGTFPKLSLSTSKTPTCLNPNPSIDNTLNISHRKTGTEIFKVVIDCCRDGSYIVTELVNGDETRIPRNGSPKTEWLEFVKRAHEHYKDQIKPFQKREEGSEQKEKVTDYWINLSAVKVFKNTLAKARSNRGPDGAKLALTWDLDTCYIDNNNNLSLRFNNGEGANIYALAIIRGPEYPFSTSDYDIEVIGMGSFKVKIKDENIKTKKVRDVVAMFETMVERILDAMDIVAAQQQSKK